MKRIFEAVFRSVLAVAAVTSVFSQSLSLFSDGWDTCATQSGCQADKKGWWLSSPRWDGIAKQHVKT